MNLVNIPVDRDTFSFSAIIFSDPNKKQPLLKGRCQQAIKEQLHQQPFQLLKYERLEENQKLKSKSAQKLKQKIKPKSRSVQKQKSQPSKKSAHLVNHNTTCEIIYGLIKKHKGIHTSVIPFSKFMRLDYGHERKTLQAVQNELKLKLIDYRTCEKGDNGSFYLRFDQQDRTIEAYIKLIEKGRKIQFCNEKWEIYEERVFLGEKKTYQYVKKTFWDYDIKQAFSTDFKKYFKILLQEDRQEMLDSRFQLIQKNYPSQFMNPNYIQRQFF